MSAVGDQSPPNNGSPQGEVWGWPEAEVSAEPVCAVAEDAQSRGCLGSFELESYPTSPKTKGGANRETRSFPGPSQSHCRQNASESQSPDRSAVHHRVADRRSPGIE